MKKIVPKLRQESRQAYLKQREEQILDQRRRDLDDEKRIFGNEDLTDIEKRLAELKENLYGLAQKRRQKEETEKLYQFPDADDDEN